MVKSDLPSRSGFTALRDRNPVDKKGPSLLYFSLELNMIFLTCCDLFDQYIFQWKYRRLQKKNKINQIWDEVSYPNNIFYLRTKVYLMIQTSRTILVLQNQAF